MDMSKWPEHLKDAFQDASGIDAAHLAKIGESINEIAAENASLLRLNASIKERDTANAAALNNLRIRLETKDDLISELRKKSEDATNRADNLEYRADQLKDKLTSLEEKHSRTREQRIIDFQQKSDEISALKEKVQALRNRESLEDRDYEAIRRERDKLQTRNYDLQDEIDKGFNTPMEAIKKGIKRHRWISSSASVAAVVLLLLQMVSIKPLDGLLYSPPDALSFTSYEEVAEGLEENSTLTGPFDTSFRTYELTDITFEVNPGFTKNEWKFIAEHPESGDQRTIHPSLIPSYKEGIPMTEWVGTSVTIAPNAVGLDHW